jgi:YVTN family beta-propeller protein
VRVLLVALVAIVATGCASQVSPLQQRWSGSFVLDADETRTSSSCIFHRIVRIEATVDCAPGGDPLSGPYGGLFSCRGSGAARYSYSLLADGDAEKQTGAGTYSGEVRPFLEFLSDPGIVRIFPPRFYGYQFTTAVPIEGTFEGERGAFHTKGPETRTLETHVYAKESSFADGQRRIDFDQEQEPRIEGTDCGPAPVTGRRHMTLHLDAASADSGTPAVRASLRATSTPVPTALPTRAIVRATPSGSRSPAPTPGASLGDVAVGKDPLGVAFDPGTGRVFVANSGSGTVSVIEAVSGRVVAVLTVGARPSGVAVNDTTGVAYVTNSNAGTVSVIDGKTASLLGTIRVGRQPSGVAVNAATGRVYVANNGDATLTTIDGTTNAVVTTTQVGGAPVGVAVDARTNDVFVANYGDGTVTVLEGTGDRVRATVNVGGRAGGTSHIAVNGARGIAYVTDNTQDVVWVINIDTLQPIASIPVAKDPWDVAVSESADRVYVTHSAEAGLTVLDGATATLITTIGTGTSYGVAVDTTSETVFTTSNGAGRLNLIR